MLCNPGKARAQLSECFGILAPGHRCCCYCAIAGVLLCSCSCCASAAAVLRDVLLWFIARFHGDRNPAALQLHKMSNILVQSKEFRTVWNRPIGCEILKLKCKANSNDDFVAQDRFGLSAILSTRRPRLGHGSARGASPALPVVRVSIRAVHRITPEISRKAMIG